MIANATNATGVPTLVWDAPWSYAESVTDGSKINGSFWFQLTVFASALVLWITVTVQSNRSQPSAQKEYSIAHDCQAARFRVKNIWALHPRIIVTRTSASLAITLAVAELVVFNAIANYTASGSVNASSALLILFAVIMFHFFTMSHKFMKVGEFATRNKFYALSSFLVLLMAVATFM